MARSPKFNPKGEDMTPERLAALTDFEREEYPRATYETRRALETVACLRLDLARCGAKCSEQADLLTTAIQTIARLSGGA